VEGDTRGVTWGDPELGSDAWQDGPVSEASVEAQYHRLGLTEAGRDLPKLLILKGFLQFYGRSMNLTGKLDEEALDEHIGEALQVVALARALGVEGRWLDVGSGGGFPGLVLAACLEVDLTLVEPRAKRASVLELGLGKLRRRHARVLRGRIEGGRWVAIEAGALEPGFAAASARAVFEPQRWIAEARPWVVEDGVIVLHLRAGEGVGGDELGRVEGGRWSAVGVRNVPRGTVG
jgi:16S rRNA (guanine527-N7)-methyltransferase